MLGLVGINANTQSGYNRKVGITLNKRTLFQIGRLTATPADEAATMASQGALPQADTISLSADFGADTGDVDMMFFALPDAPPALVAESVSATQTASSSAMTTYGVCAFASNTAGLGDELSPSRFLLDLLPKDFTDRLKINGLSQREWDWLGRWYEQVTVDVLSKPQHGKADNTSSLTYYADQGYKGKDRMEIVVSGKNMVGHTISMKIIYFINAVSNQEFGNVADNYSQSLFKYCHARSESWRVTKAPTGRRRAN